MRCLAPHDYAEYVDRTGDVLDFPCPEVLESQAQLVEHIVADRAADANAAGLRQRLQTRRDVDAVTKNIVVIDDDVADVDADPEVDALLGRQTRIPLGHAALHVDRAAHRVDDAGELQQQSIAGSLDDPAVVLSDLGVDQLAPVRFQGREGGAVIPAHEKGISDHVGRNDGGKSTVIPCHSLPQSFLDFAAL